MKSFKKILLLIATSMSLLSYGSLSLEHENIDIVNKSENKIVFQPQILTPDLSNEDRVYQCKNGAIGVGSESTHQLPAGTHSDWEGNLSGDSFLKILILDGESYSNYMQEPCDTFRKYVPVLQLYQLTLKDVQLLNWTISYPPTETMKNMKIYYPSYLK